MNKNLVCRAHVCNCIYSSFQLSLEHISLEGEKEVQGIDLSRRKSAGRRGEGRGGGSREDVKIE